MPHSSQCSWNDVSMHAIGLRMRLGVVVASAVLAAGCSGGEKSAESDPLVARGEVLAERCAGCHSTDGSSRSGPTWKGLAGSQVTLTDGRVVAADDEYLKRSILDPNAEIVDGFQKTMAFAVPPGSISEDDANALIAYIRSVRG